MKETKLYNINEAAKELRIAPKTLYRWISERKITFCKLGSRVLFDESDLNELIRQNKVNKIADNKH